VPKRYPDLLLDDMLDCLKTIQAYTGLLPMADLLASGLHKDAIIRNFEVLGEAANKVPEAIRQMAPDIPWQQMVSLRNRLIHEYHGIDWDILLPVILEDVPRVETLLQQVRQQLPR